MCLRVRVVRTVTSPRLGALRPARFALPVSAIALALSAVACTGGGKDSPMPPLTTSIHAIVLRCSFTQDAATIRVSFDTTPESPTPDATFEGALSVWAVTSSGLKDLGLQAETPRSGTWTAFTFPSVVGGSRFDAIEINSLFLSVHADQREEAASPSDLVGHEFRVPGGMTATVGAVRRGGATLVVGLAIPSPVIEPGVSVSGASGTLTLDGRTFRSSESSPTAYAGDRLVATLLFPGATGDGPIVLRIRGWSIAVERGPRIPLSDCP